MLNKFILIGFLCFGLIGCVPPPTTVPVITKTQVVVLPPKSLYVCPVVEIPDRDLTNKDVAGIIIEFYDANQQCRTSLSSIKNFLNKAAKKYKSK